MIVNVPVVLRAVRHGIEARSAALNLSGHGPNDEAAVQSLRRAVLGWCVGLAARGELERALDRRAVSYEPGSETTVIETTVVKAT